MLFCSLRPQAIIIDRRLFLFAYFLICHRRRTCLARSWAAVGVVKGKAMVVVVVVSMMTRLVSKLIRRCRVNHGRLRSKRGSH